MRTKECLVVCSTSQEAGKLFNEMNVHFIDHRIGGVTKVDRAHKRFIFLGTYEIRVVSEEEYFFKCQCGFRGKVVSGYDIWRMLDEDKKRLQGVPK